MFKIALSKYYNSKLGFNLEYVAGVDNTSKGQNGARISGTSNNEFRSYVNLASKRHPKPIRRFS